MSSQTAPSKYGHLLNAEFGWADSDMSINTHALERWDQRTPHFSHSPEYAWDHGAVVPEWFFDPFIDKWGHEPDEVRVFHEHADVNYQVALVARGGIIRTVLDCRDFSAPTKGFLNALKPSVGGDT